MGIFCNDKWGMNILWRLHISTLIFFGIIIFVALIFAHMYFRAYASVAICLFGSPIFGHLYILAFLCCGINIFKHWYFPHL